MKKLSLLNHSKPVILLYVVFWLASLSTYANNNSPVTTSVPLKWKTDGIHILLEDHLNLSEMAWPVTLLEYEVDFSSEEIAIDDLVLVDLVSNQAVPFQLTNISLIGDDLQSANVCFQTDLPAGSKERFLLRKKNLADPVIESLGDKVEVIKTSDQLLVQNSRLKLCIPSPGKYQKLIPPIIQFGNREKWLGHSNISSQFMLDEMIVNELSYGDVLAEYQIDYHFDGGKSFQLKLRLAANMEFLEMEENMIGFTGKDSMSWKIIWNGFEPEYRYCHNRPGAPTDKKGVGYKNFAWEPIDGFEGDPKAEKHPDLPYDQKNLPSGQLPIKIAPYHNWLSWWRLPAISFWNETTDQSIGIFIKDFEKWVDPAYPIWGSKDNLSIHFFHKDGFYWDFPMVEGKRSLALAIYPHQKDRKLVDEINLAQSYTDYLFRWYSWVSLDKTKSWILDYDSPRSQHPAFFTTVKSDEEVHSNDLLNALKRNVQSVSTSTSRGKGPNPVGTREFYERIAPMFEKSEHQLSEQQYRQARAWFLFMTYLYMDETLMPIRNLLSGHPNFLADIKGVPGLAAFLFPDHPQATEMANHFEKATALNLRYHTRPDEPVWEAKGGRWTENLSCYTWAFLRPTLKTTTLLHYFYDGKNRILQPNISLYGNWLLNSLTSPLDKENGRRGYPPQGAHSRVVVPSNLLFTLGHELYYYDPLLAEKIFWVSSPEDHGFENKKGRPDSWDEAARKILNYPGGTNPRLKSEKYTGYGFSLRSHFGELDEMYVHLQQIDEGPNYRWGRAAKGGNGIIYYYAEGKQYSNNGIEDVGDDYFGDVEHCTNFGVKKEKSYRCIGDYRSVGKNDLTDPLYDFGFAQFASIQANSEASPEYKSRSVLMYGNDYILVFDDVKDDSVEGRLSWFVGDEDDFPFIHQLTPGTQAKNVNLDPDHKTHFSEGRSLSIKGKYFDGKGDFLTLVTHRPGIVASEDEGAYQVSKNDGSVDWVFRYDSEKAYSKNQLHFEGTAGIIKQSADEKSYEAALFEGHKIGIPDLVMELKGNKPYGGISLKSSEKGFSGFIQVREERVVKFLPQKKVRGLTFYLDGVRYPLSHDGDAFICKVSKGKYRWQWTKDGVIPDAPQIEHSIVGKDWCRINWNSIPGAKSYLVQLSNDAGKSWITLSETAGTEFKVTELETGEKRHVRVIAKGEGGLGEPSRDYPVYPGNDLPHAPEGLRLALDGHKINLSWGQILGADHYKLYQREKGQSEYQLIYTGSARLFSVEKKSNSQVYEFAVTATNGNGESEKSVPADTDESSFINWDPVPGEIYRRDTESQENGYFEYNHWIEQEMPVLKYPFQN